MRSSRRERRMPSRETVRKAVAAIKRPADYQYLFDRLQSPGWIQPLRQEGFLRRPPEAEREGGYIRFPLWPESRYLARMASLEPELVASVFLDMEDTKNVRVQEDAIDAALAMPPVVAARLVPRAVSWIDSPYRLLLPEKLGRLVVHLATGGLPQPALRLADALLRPVAPDQEAGSGNATYPRTPEPESRYHAWEYEQVAKAVVPALVAADPVGTLTLLADLLQLAVEITVPDATPPRDLSFLWRPAIEESDQNHAISGARDVLVQALRDATQAHVRSRPSALPEVIAALEARPWGIFHRIALHLLTSELNVGWDLAKERALDRSRVDDADQFHEYWLLVRAAFTRLQPSEQQAVLDAIDSGPDTTPKDDAEHYAEVWRLRRLAVLKDVLGTPWRNRYDELVQTLGFEPDHPEFLSYSTGIWVGPTSPKERDDLLSMPVGDLVRFLREWKPGDDFMAPSPEGLGRALAAAVATEPERFAGAAMLFQDLDPTYVRSAIQGWRDAVREGRSFSWAPVLDLCQWAIEQESDETPDAGDVDRDPGWPWTRRAIADLVGAGLGQGSCEIPYSLRDEVWAVLEPLTRDPDPTPEHEERYGGANMDPPTLAINTTRGEAIHSTIRYGLWVHRTIKAARREAIEVDFDTMPEVRSVLDGHLRIEVDPSVAIRSAYGQWFPWLALLDKRWVEGRLGDIFPDDPQVAHLRDAAWEAYLVFCPPYDTIFELLRDEYRKAIERLEEQASLANHRPGSPEERLGQHLITLLLRGKIQLDDELVTRFFERVREDVRRDTLARVGEALRVSPDLPREVAERAMRLWEARLAMARAQPESHRKELAAFGEWFASAKLPEAWSLEQLVAALRVTRGKVDADDLVLERLASVVETHPAVAVESVRLIAEGDREGWTLVGSYDNVHNILAAALSSGQPDVRDAATDLIHILGARGFKDLRTLLLPDGSQARRDAISEPGSP
jgi:hypothetical protein